MTTLFNFADLAAHVDAGIPLRVHCDPVLLEPGQLAVSEHGFTVNPADLTRTVAMLQEFGTVWMSFKPPTTETL